MSSKTLKHLDLFSGYGGFTISARKHGIETINFSEIDKYATAVLKYRFPSIKNLGDITKIKPEDLPDVDIITGGSPCQDLSVAGKGAGLNGARSGLFFYFINIIEKKQPMYFIWENVKGALSSSKGWDFARVQIEMEQAGYDVFWQVINAKDFGVPQNRERIFAIGIRKGSGREILFEQRESGQNINKIVDTGHDGTNIFGTDGIAPTQKALGGGQGAKTGLYMVGMVDVTVKKRKHDTPVGINEYLRKHKVGTIGEIAEKLELPKTQVEHYFRTDSSRAVPSPDVWLKLKELLGLDDTYDKQVTDFYEKEMEFESTRRIYDSKGVAKTTDTSGTGLYAVDITRRAKAGLYAIPNSNGNIYSLDANYRKGGNTPNKSRRSQIVVHNLQPRSPNRPSLLKNKNAGGSGHLQREDGITYTIDTGCTQGVAVPTQIGECERLAVPVLTPDRENKRQSGRRFKEDGDSSFTITGQDRHGVFNGTRIRRLTPTECERLMGLEDGWTAKGIIDGKEVDISDTQRYKLCGNGVVVDCVDYIFDLIIKSKLRQ